MIALAIILALFLACLVISTYIVYLNEVNWHLAQQERRKKRHGEKS